MIELFGDLIRSHGWHVVAELLLLVLATVFTAFYVAALVRGRVRAVECAGCGRIASRAHAECPRCGTSLPTS
ncbi:MAG TPA: hypothetical protein VF058_10915 [Actinomycetota bacterium]